MRITNHALWAAMAMVAVPLTVLAQGQNQFVGVGSGPLYTFLNLPRVAPGGILTLFTAALGVPDAVATQIPLPNSLSGVSVLARVVGATDTRGYPASLPILRIYTQNAPQMPDGVYCPTNPNSVYCSNTQITIEIPTEGVCAPSPLFGQPPKSCATPPFNDRPPLLILNVSAKGLTGPDLPLQVDDYAPRLLNSCDSIFGPALTSNCHPLVTHSDGTLVSNDKPAKPGESIAVYAVGFGQPIAGTGYSPAKPIPLLPGSFGLTFQYAVPGATIFTATSISVRSDWIGLLPSYVGLYQVNVTVPPAPGDAYQACGSNGNAGITFSLNSGTLYICVQP